MSKSNPLPIRRKGARTEGVVGWRCDPNTFRFTWVSAEASKLLGFAEERWLFEPRFWQDRLHPEDREWAVAFCLERSTRLEPYEFEYRMIAADGRVVWVWDAVHVIAEGGRPKDLVGVLVDVTARKGEEQALRESEATLRSLIAEAADFIVTVAVDGTILSVNRTVPGVTREEVTGSCVYDYAQPEWRDAVRNYVEGVFRTGEPVVYEAAGLGPDGRTSWYSVRASPIHADGRVSAVTLISTDVTVRRQAEEALRGSEAEHRALLEAIPDLILRIRDDGTFLDFRRGRDVEPALPPNQFLGRRIQDVFEGGLSARVLARVKEGLRTGQTQTLEYSLPHPYPDGEPRQFEARLVPAGSNEALILVRDVAGRGAVEGELARVLEDARARCEALLRGPGIDAGARAELEETARGLRRASALLGQLRSARG